MYHSLKNWLHFDAFLIPEFNYESYKRNPIATCGAMLLFIARNCIGQKKRMYSTKTK